MRYVLHGILMLLNFPIFLAILVSITFNMFLTEELRLSASEAILHSVNLTFLHVIHVISGKQCHEIRTPSYFLRSRCILSEKFVIACQPLFGFVFFCVILFPVLWIYHDLKLGNYWYIKKVTLFYAPLLIIWCYLLFSGCICTLR